MSFLTPILLTLAGFAAIPVLLHLIRRKRVRILDFPTFRLLKKAAMEQRFHLRLQDQLLMFLRMLILLLLAVAFAGPSVKKSFPENTRYLGSTNILVVDDSLSMSVIQNGTSLYDSALEVATTLLERQPGTWKVVFASEVMSASDPLRWPLSDRDSFQQKVSSHGLPVFRGPMAGVVEKLTSTKKTDELIWLLTDRTSSNWSKWTSSPLEDTDRIHAEVLQIGENVTAANAAITRFSLLNEPLYEEEPASLSVAYEVFGATGPFPLGVRLGWREGNIIRHGASLPITESNVRQGTLETLIESAGQVSSVSAHLWFPGGISDPLPLDDTVVRQPRSLNQVKVQVLAARDEWLNLLKASLVGFDVQVADFLQPPPPSTTDMSVHVVVLGAEPVSPGWGEILSAKVQSGAGLVVFYDQASDGVRLQTWSDWWQSWDSTGLAETIPAGDMKLLGGADAWFFQGLDVTARDVTWAQDGFNLFHLNHWDTELAVKASSDTEFPLFQSRRFGQGFVANWTVPLSLKNTSLVLTNGWVPLLSQVVKCSISDSEKADLQADQMGWVNESDLSPLSTREKDQLGVKGLVFSDAMETLREIETLPRSQQDWTLVVLLLCLGLALFEIGLSNYL